MLQLVSPESLSHGPIASPTLVRATIAPITDSIPCRVVLSLFVQVKLTFKSASVGDKFDVDLVRGITA
jgi:hypothetical protein